MSANFGADTVRVSEQTTSAIFGADPCIGAGASRRLHRTIILAAANESVRRRKCSR